ncbi:MAG: hypothetical protein WDN24_09980 [Sphingomonas sp.]
MEPRLWIGYVLLLAVGVGATLLSVRLRARAERNLHRHGNPDHARRGGWWRRR